VPLKSINDIDGKIVQELIKNSQDDYKEIDARITSLNESSIMNIAKLFENKERFIVTQDPRSLENQFEAVDELEIAFNREIDVYYDQSEVLTKIKKKIKNFISYLSKDLEENKKNKKILAKFVQPQLPSHSPNLISSPIKVEIKASYPVRPSTPKGVIPPSPIKPSDRRPNSEISPILNIGEDLRIELLNQDFNDRRNLLFYFLPSKKLFVFNKESLEKTIYDIRTNLIISSGLNYCNVADKYLFFFNSSANLNYSETNKGFLLDLKDMTVKSLPKSYFSKKYSNPPLAYSGSLYFFGGLSHDQQSKSNDCEVFNVLDSSWKILTPLDTPAFNVSCVNFDNWIYLTSNDFRSVKRYHCGKNEYQNYFNHEAITDFVGNSFLIKIGNALFFFYHKGIYLINDTAYLKFYGTISCFGIHKQMIQYVVRGDSVYIMMITQSIIKFSPGNKQNHAEVIYIKNN
jgi:hypothetical protein